MQHDYMQFECMQCAKIFDRRWFEITRAFARVHYLSPSALDEVEIEDAEGIGTFCSQSCMAIGRNAVMQAQGVPVPPVRPGIGPLEACARCKRPVDMSDWHLTYTDGCNEETAQGINILDIDYIAVVCRECESRAEDSRGQTLELVAER